MVQVRTVEAAVRSAMTAAAITDPGDVHFVQIKCPLLTAEAIADAARCGQRVVTSSTYGSMGYSRGASALGEIPPGAVDDGAICKRWDLFSRVASMSAGVELEHCEILALGNAAGSPSDLVISHDVMSDAIDANAVRRAMAGAGVDGDRSRVVGIFAKAEAEPSGRIRGRRHTMMDDSDINHTRRAHAAVAAVIASIIGDNRRSDGLRLRRRRASGTERWRPGRGDRSGVIERNNCYANPDALNTVLKPRLPKLWRAGWRGRRPMDVPQDGYCQFRPDPRRNSRPGSAALFSSLCGQTR